MLKDNIKQRQVVAFYKELRGLQGDGKLSDPEYKDCILRAAIKAEMIDGISNIGTVDDMDPKEAIRLANQVANYLVELMKVDPN